MEEKKRLSVEINKIDKGSFKIQEAYNTLRTNIQFCGSDVKVITLTSCTPNEGKSLVSFRLANSFAEAGQKVLFIDADIRRSVFIGRYRIQQKVFGLSHYLAGQKKIDEIVYETNVSNLDMIFSGPAIPNPSELLGSTNFTELIKLVREPYDYVIIDGPPLGSVIDSALIAKNCDGAVLVIEAGEISYKFAQEVNSQMEKSGCRMLGAILNKVDTENKMDYYNNYYGGD